MLGVPPEQCIKTVSISFLKEWDSVNAVSMVEKLKLMSSSYRFIVFHDVSGNEGNTRWWLAAMLAALIGQSSQPSHHSQPHCTAERCSPWHAHTLEHLALSSSLFSIGTSPIVSPSCRYGSPRLS